MFRRHIRDENRILRTGLGATDCRVSCVSLSPLVSRALHFSHCFLFASYDAAQTGGCVDAVALGSCGAV